MATTPQLEKSDLRRVIRSRIKALSPAQRAARSSAACALLQEQSVWQKAQSVLFYAPFGTELDVWQLLTKALAEGKKAVLPRFSVDTGCYIACEVQDIEREVVAGHLGIREPSAACRTMPFKLDLILVPGIAYDVHGRRLGRGKGFYDRLLAVVRGTTCGVAFDEQIVSAVPVEPHDVVLDCILTPTRWLQR